MAAQSTLYQSWEQPMIVTLLRDCKTVMFSTIPEGTQVRLIGQWIQASGTIKFSAETLDGRKFLHLHDQDFR